MKEIAALPSGHVGIYRAPDGRRWESYVMKKDLFLLGVFATKRGAVEARARYWQEQAKLARPSNRQSGT
jgi:hypothetical protein